MSSGKPGQLRPAGGNAPPPAAATAAKPSAPQPLKPAQPTALKPAGGGAPAAAAAAAPQPAKPAGSPPPAAASPKPATAKTAASPTAAASGSSSKSAAAAAPILSSPTARSAAASASPAASQHPSTQRAASSSAATAASSSSSASGARTDRPNLLASSSVGSKGKDLPLNVKMVLQKRPEMWADPMFAHNYPVEVWEHYDVNKDGILNKSELIVLAKDLVDRIISMCKDGMRTSMPKSSESDIDKMIKKELPHILPAKTLEESRKVMADHIFRELDLDKDGVITRTEFFFQWQSVSQKVLDVNKVKQEALACVIL